MKLKFGNANIQKSNTNRITSFLSMPSFPKKKTPILEKKFQSNKSIIGALEVIFLRVATLRLKFQDL